MRRFVIGFLTTLALSLLLSKSYAGTDLVGCQTDCRKTITWTGCGISKKGFMKELAGEYGRKHQITFALTGGGATKGIRAVVKGKAHMGGMCRLPLPKATMMTKAEVGVKKEVNSLLIPMGWDALVVIVHKDNPINDISSKELKKILKGKITSWSQLKESKGRKGKFNLYIRPGRISGVGRTLRQTLFDNNREVFTKTAKIKKSSGVIEKQISGDVNGIAVSGFSSANKRKGLKLLSLNGYKSSMENVSSGKYPVYRLLLLTFMKESLVDPDILAFAQYAKSQKAASIIKRAGTLPLAEGLNLYPKLKDSYLMEIFSLESSRRYNPSNYDLREMSKKEIRKKELREQRKKKKS